MKPRVPLGQGLDVRMSEARVDRAWESVWRAVPRRRALRRSMRAFAYVGVAAMMALVAVVFLSRLKPDDAFEAAVIETGPGEEQTLQLADGSRLLLSPSTRLHLEHLGRRSVRLELERGKLDAEVTHVSGRTFVVAARDVEIGVVGTHFEVALDPSDGQIHVSVSEGRVRLTSGDGGAEGYVSAGQTWSSMAYLPPQTESPSATDAAASVVAEPPSAAPVHQAAPRRSALTPGFTALYRQERYAEAYDALGNDGFALATQSGTPGELMMLAETARLSRHPTDAALAFDTLRSRYPHDSRAALAAMELGRLRLNELDDPEGAKSALEDAIRLDPAGPLREDAEARRVEAIERTGDHGACRAARDRYLADHPQGVHAASVSRMCR